MKRNREVISLIWRVVGSDLGSPCCESPHFISRTNQMQTRRCIWVRLCCLFSSSTARRWAHPCQPVPPWTWTMWGRRGSRRYEVKSWANSDWQVRHTPSRRLKSLFKSKRCITAPRSCWGSCGETGRKNAARTTQRQSTMPKRYTNSTWSDRKKTVSNAVYSGSQVSNFSFFSTYPSA